MMISGIYIIVLVLLVCATAVSLIVLFRTRRRSFCCEGGTPFQSDYFRTAIESIQDAFWVCSSDWKKVVYVSPAYAIIWDQQIEDLRMDSFSWVNAVYEDDLGKISGVISSGSISGQQKFPDFRIRRKNGLVRWISLRVFPFQNDSSDCMILCAAEDITERKRSEDMFDRAFRENPCSMSISDLETGRYVEVNNAWLSTMEFQREDVVGFTARELSVYKNISDRNRIIDAIKATGRVNGIEVEFISKAGNSRFGMFFAEIVEIAGKNMMLSTILNITVQKKMEHALEASERKFHALFDTMTEGMALHEIVRDSAGNPCDYRVLYVNSAYETHTQLKPTHVIGRLATEIYGVGIPPYFKEFESVSRTRIPLRFESYFESVEKYYSISVVSPAEGQFATIFEDITERKKNEQILKESETRYRYLFEQNPASMLVYERITFRIIAVNDAFVLNYGYSHEEALGLLLSDFYPENERQSIKTFASGLNGYANAGEWHHIHKNGSIMTIVAHSHDIVFEGKNARIAVITDITERKKAEEEIGRLKNYLSNVINSNPTILVGLDKMMRVTLVNREAEIVTGKESSEAIGKSAETVLNSFAPWLAALKEGIEKRKQVIKPRQYVEMNGEHRYYDIVSYPLVSEEENGAVVRIDDVTETVRREEQLRQAQKMETVGTLAGGLAHDFNNVLGGIIGSVGLVRYILEDDRMLAEKIGGHIDLIERAGNRASEIVKQLLSLSRRHEISLIPVDLNIALKNVIQICSSSFEKSIEIVVDYPSSPAMIEADPSQVEQVFLNLCVNASHAMTIMRKADEHQGGVLSVSIRKIRADRIFCERHTEAIEGNYWMVSFADTGVGMEESTQQKIFDPFFTTKDKQHGTGLGLSMSYNNVHQHKGFIDVYSESGIGSTFNVYLPVREICEGEEVVSNDDAIVKGNGTVLVIDDEEIVRSIAASILIECGYDVISADGGREGITLFEENPQRFDIVLLDMAMPGLSGKEVYLELRKIKADVKVLLSSGFRQDSRVEETLALGINGFIQKPYSMAELSAKVNSIIGRNPQ